MKRNYYNHGFVRYHRPHAAFRKFCCFKRPVASHSTHALNIIYYYLLSSISNLFACTRVSRVRVGTCACVCVCMRYNTSCTVPAVAYERRVHFSSHVFSHSLGSPAIPFFRVIYRTFKNTHRRVSRTFLPNLFGAPMCVYENDKMIVQL